MAPSLCIRGHSVLQSEIYALWSFACLQEWRCLAYIVDLAAGIITSSTDIILRLGIVRLWNPSEPGYTERYLKNTPEESVRQP